MFRSGRWYLYSNALNKPFGIRGSPIQLVAGEDDHIGSKPSSQPADLTTPPHRGKRARMNIGNLQNCESVPGSGKVWEVEADPADRRQVVGAGVPHPVAAERPGKAEGNLPLAMHLLEIQH